ncbi:MAG: glycosyltransferase [Erythrobacter sp.]|jgi:glycosyltransferase involved in cell wall biosynthesis|nr:glycosyltransferase [Erythrobacter sp.]
MSDPKAPPRILHCHSTFAIGGKERRAVQLMNAFGKRLEHTVVSGVEGRLEARELVARGVKVRYPEDFPKLTGRPSPGRLVTIAQALKGYDLVLTYNWGAMDVVLAHTVFGKTFGLPPLIHHEDGFDGADGSERNRRMRSVYRRIALEGADALVVPSRTLETIALKRWHQKPSRITRIPNGIDTRAFAARPKPAALRVVKRRGEKWVGTLAALRPVKRLDQLVEAFALLPPHWQLVILGEGETREAIGAAARRCGIEDRVHLPGNVSDPASVIGLFDIFALSSASEQFPLSLVEAMAAGLPVAASDVGDVRAILAEENASFLTPPGDPKALGEAMDELAADADLRKEIGKANRARAREQFDEAAMIERYRALYAQHLGRDF